jgi:hypothetical protein
MRHSLLLLGVAAAVALGAAPASAQITKVEISGNAGYTFSEGIEFANRQDLGGKTYTGIEPKDAASWGFQIGAVGYHLYEIGFLYDRQLSKLSALSPTGDKDVADMNVDNYHGYIGFNFAREERTAMPFLFVGFGATSYGGFDLPANAETATGVHHIEGNSRFSTTWGAGVKIYPQRRQLGLRLLARWTPTYIQTNPGSVWCDPYWGCTTVGDSEYSHAIELTGGVVLKFPVGK